MTLHPLLQQSYDKNDEHWKFWGKQNHWTCVTDVNSTASLQSNMALALNLELS